ncbi:hypothetical protein D3C79_671200 [compost metagenome]
MAGNGLQRQRRDKGFRRAGHYHTHFGASVTQAAYQFWAFVCGDAATDAKHNMFAGKSRHHDCPIESERCAILA